MIYALIGAAALIASICIVASQAAGDLDHLTPTGYDPAPPADERGPIVVNPGREPW